MKGRPPTKSEQEYHNMLISIVGCIVCREFYSVFNDYASIHHCDGRTKPGCHKKVLPLCGNHHQIPDTQKPSRWISRHGSNGNGKAAFEAEYDTEKSLIAKCDEILKEAA